MSFFIIQYQWYTMAKADSIPKDSIAKTLRNYSKYYMLNLQPQRIFCKLECIELCKLQN